MGVCEGQCCSMGVRRCSTSLSHHWHKIVAVLRFYLTVVLTEKETAIEFALLADAAFERLAQGIVP